MNRLHIWCFTAAVGLFFLVPTHADILAVENGIPDVLSFSPTGTRSIFATSTNLDSPIGIALDSLSNVYVVDQGVTDTSAHTNSIAKYSPTGTPLGFYVTPSTPPGNTLNAPLDIAFDANDNGYVTSQTAPNPPYGYVAQFNSAGAFQLSFGTSNTNVPSGIVYNAVNHLLYLVNSATAGSAGPNLNSILIYNPANLAAAPTIITPTGAGALDAPQQIAVDSSGNIYIASSGQISNVAKIQEYTASGTYVRTIASVNGGGAEGVAFDPITSSLYASFLSTGGADGFIEKYAISAGSVTDDGAFATGLNGPAFLAFTSVPEPGSALVLAVSGLAVVFRRQKRG